MFGIALGCVTILVVRIVHADVPAPPASDDEWPQSPNTPAAQSRFDEGVELARAANYPGASQAFRLSFEQSPSRSALFAWAQSERLAGRCEKAVPLYERFMKNAPPPEQQQAAQIALRRCAEAPFTTESTPVPPTVSATPPQVSVPVVKENQAPPDGVVWPLVATGGSLVVAGAVMLFVSQFEIQSADKADSYQNYRDARSRSKMEQVIGWSSTTIGLATLGAAAWIAWRPTGQTEATPRSLSLVPSTAGPGSMLASFRGEF